MTRIDRFRGPHLFLSNFYQHSFTHNGKEYGSAEHLYQALKAITEEDHERIRLAPYPGDAKALGRIIKTWPDWNDQKIDAMRLTLRAKFSDRWMAKMLLDTGDAELVEGNTWRDTFWGVYKDEGENWLGRLLMELRYGLRKEQGAAARS